MTTTTRWIHAAHDLSQAEFTWGRNAVLREMWRQSVARETSGHYGA